jgi:putative membrane protein
LDEEVRVTDPAARFEVRVTSDSHFGWLRTRLSFERTLLAWLRTAAALIGFGFTIVQFFERFSEMQGVDEALRPQAPRYLGLALIGAGVLGLVISLWQYRKGVNYLWSADFRPIAGMNDDRMSAPSFAAAIVVLLIGLFAFGAIFLRFL